ncbi:ribonuclease H-like domain-containing protein [Tanacetum coccineum]|uniref:Ribonuclease H-like domain-containing protein n=1 Tax=Tanacetum coccineum TaxID=301880 RepID=A0ABQ5DX13_9ASTR
MGGCNSSRTPVDNDPRLGDGGTTFVILTLKTGVLAAYFQSTTDSLISYTDADWTGCPTNRDDAEYHGVANVVAETCWIRNLLRELHTPLSSATIVYCDNVSVCEH